MQLDNLALVGGEPVCQIDSPHYVWPRVTPAMKNAVLEQMDDSLSLYNRSGVIATFEDVFANYHGKKHALLNNSGTNSIHAAAIALGLRPGDEVIVPVYTFFATASPLMFLGVKPIFCDCGLDGNLDPYKLESLITTKTKAVMVTHMWGIPCQMDRIKSICDASGLSLVEDCSHAHGAEFDGKKVGTFGSIGIWSLQGQKIVTGGEGGVLVTDDSDLFSRALLTGHYNKRCKDEISRTHELADFSVTGFGLKHRSHPLAVAIALEQFQHLDEWIAQKTKYAALFDNVIQEFPFLKAPLYDAHRQKPAWYAYVFHFHQELANDVSIDQFEKALKAEGLRELDRPGSTCPLHAFPLFLQPERAFPGLYEKDAMKGRNNESFAVAELYYQSALKLPVWAFADEREIVEQYVSGIRKVSQWVMQDPEVFREDMKTAVGG
ncbi:MAG: DegT/DnrJ/EryC1/StrS family aminotransferase [Bdellovibrionales bacterium]|nr:DegT/DnrJ/EryC1/StrS family aminotransferase [Bdellovibrionales bacterium]